MKKLFTLIAIMAFIFAFAFTLGTGAIGQVQAAATIYDENSIAPAPQIASIGENAETHIIFVAIRGGPGYLQDANASYTNNQAPKVRTALVSNYYSEYNDTFVTAAADIRGSTAYNAAATEDANSLAPIRMSNITDKGQETPIRTDGYALAAISRDLATTHCGSVYKVIRS